MQPQRLLIQSRQKIWRPKSGLALTLKPSRPPVLIACSIKADITWEWGYPISFCTVYTWKTFKCSLCLCNYHNGNWYCRLSLKWRLTNYSSNTVYLFRLGHRLTFTEERWAVAKDASIQNEDTFDIYDPRNPLNKRRREESSQKQRQKHGRDRTRTWLISFSILLCV